MKGVKEMRDQLQELMEKRVRQCVEEARNTIYTCPKIERKKESMYKRNAEIVKAKANGKIISSVIQTDELTSVRYSVHFQYLIKQKNELYIEEEIEERSADFYKNVLVDDNEMNPYPIIEAPAVIHEDNIEERNSYPYKYDRRKAVQYAEKWWNSYNPAFKTFDVDCTNYISQCLHAGDGPMRGYPNRGKGWWMRSNNWSYSWTVAHSMRTHLSSSTIGLRAKEVNSPEKLLLGDVICYDFQGDGRFDHTTIVTGVDAEGLPLVNAHTTNSRMRFWDYEDSTAYTPNIKYKFFTICDDR